MVRFGIIGTNRITENFLGAASLLPDFQLTAVYSRTEEKAQAFASKFGALHTFTDLTEMAKSDVIDAVYIASPNSFHAEQSILFLENKKHVLCEKPLASNVTEVSAMIEAAKQNQVLLMEAMMPLFLPNFQILQHNLHKIGAVQRYFANFCKYSSRYDAYKLGELPNAFNPIFSNGALMDIGVYCIYPMTALFGMPTQIQANATMLESGVDGKGSILLNHGDFDGIISYSKITNSHVQSEIQGEKGTITLNHMSVPSKIVIHYHDGTTEDISQPQKEQAMYYEAKEFIELIQNGKLESDINTFERSLQTMRIMDDVRQQIGLVFPADEK